MTVETEARRVAELVVSRSPIAQTMWTDEQKKRHVDQCWPEYADLLQRGYIDQNGTILKPLPEMP